ncbi:MAG: hypothetical protein DMF91_05370 [Acidobacteria bacterium]|nr:MAG: hypothetical protein DMF91_05370 [Acidobacteriota bacterium]
MTDALTRGRGLDDLIATVRNSRARLVDAWEATALIESLGYTDTRVGAEFGFPDTMTLGTYVFDRLSRDVRASGAAGAEPPRHLLVDFANSAGSTLVYAIPWLIAFIAESINPDILRLPGHTGPSLSIALMLSLIVSGGFIQAISRRGQFYVGMRQPELAALVCGYLFRLGAAVTVAIAVAGVATGWYFGLFSWPYLLLAADQFIILSLLWMTCAMLAVRHEYWRQPIAFGAGAIAFIALRAAGRDALLAEIIASAVVLAAAFVQVPLVFASESHEQLAEVPLPRMTVVLYRVLPFFWYGTAYFCFLFADRFAASASVAALTGAPFGLRATYKLGMDIALLTFLFASAGVEYANIRFTRWIKTESRAPYISDRNQFGRALGRHHLWMLALVAGVFLPTAAVVAVLVKWLLPAEPASVWTMAALGDLGYLLFALALLNMLVLFSLNRPWMAVKSLTAGLAANIGVGFVLSHAVNTSFATAGLIVGAALVAALSTIAVRRTLRRADYALAAA